MEWLQQQSDAESPSLERSGNRSLGIGGNARAAESSLSVLEVAAQHERPGVQTPSNKAGLLQETAGADGLEEEGKKGHHTSVADAGKPNEDGSLGNGVAISVSVSASTNTGTDGDTSAKEEQEEGDGVDKSKGVGLVELQSPFEVEGEGEA